ncbi:hypothetical protein MMC20_001445 [Loxospora ochrophaea]|nr:hypothetical protein [Loxospora ochrophaea]
MAGIFQDAASALKLQETPSRRPESNIKKARISSYRRIPFGRSFARDTDLDELRESLTLSGNYDGKISPEPVMRFSVSRSRVFPTSLPYLHNHSNTSLTSGGNKEPPSSGFTTPVENKQNPAVPDPTFSKSESRHSTAIISSFDLESENEDCHSTHGVPLVIPIHNPSSQRLEGSKIDAWLDQVLSLPSDDSLGGHNTEMEELLGPSEDLLKASHPQSGSALSPQLTKNNLLDPLPLSRPPSMTSSNKENVSPANEGARPPTPPARLTPLSYYIASPFRRSTSPPNTRCNSFENAKTIRTSSTSRFQSPGTPCKLLSLAPKRKQRKGQARTVRSLKFVDAVRTDRPEFEIHEDENDCLVELSPHVERYRKGKGHKKIRCPSYFDRDIFRRASDSTGSMPDADMTSTQFNPS